jgi:hypothetical protein
MFTRLTIAILCLGISFSATETIAQISKDQVVGTWTVVAVRDIHADGTATDSFGPNPKGTATFDSKGHFSIIIIRSDLPKFASDNRTTGSTEENKAVIQGSSIYYGSYSVSEADKSLIFHVEGSAFPNWTGTTQKRAIKTLSGDDMTLTNAAASQGGVAEIQWRRIK